MNTNRDRKGHTKLRMTLKLKVNRPKFKNICYFLKSSFLNNVRNDTKFGSMNTTRDLQINHAKLRHIFSMASPRHEDGLGRQANETSYSILHCTVRWSETMKVNILKCPGVVKLQNINISWEKKFKIFWEMSWGAPSSKFKMATVLHGNKYYSVIIGSFMSVIIANRTNSLTRKHRARLCFW